jgi:hypothetical protein
MSAGNSGDLTDIGGSPGNAVSSLQVASTVDSFQLRDGLTVDAPSDVAGTAAGQMSVAYDWANNGPSGLPVSGEVVPLSAANADGCSALSPDDAAAVFGKVAWLIWDDNDATRVCGSVGRSSNVKAAGAIGAIFTSGLDVFSGGITGDADIPVLQLPLAEVTRLQPALDAGTLQVTFDGALQAQVKSYTPSISDTLSSFSSRGSHGSIGVVKPDVAAPGDTIASAGMGTGSQPFVFSGTSMASPNAAGIAALVKSRHRGWSPLMLKAAMMNTAVHDVFTLPGQKGRKYAPARVGAGRVDALEAATTKLVAYVAQPDNGVSASFGVVEAPINKSKIVRTKKLTVVNTSGKKQTVKLSYQAVNPTPGSKYTVSPSTLTIKPKKKATATLKLTVVPDLLRHKIDKTMEPTQLGLPRQFVSDSSGRVLVKQKGKASLRVPVYAAAKPVSTTSSAAVGGNVVTSGTGIEQPDNDPYVSVLSVMQLGDESPQLPVCATGDLPSGCTSNVSEKATDIKMVGAGMSDLENSFWFGVSTYGDWANLGTWVIPYVDYDLDGDGSPDVETYVQTITDTDIPVAWTVDYNTGDVIDAEPINGFFADIDTNVFDTNVVLMPVFKDAFPAGALPANGEITYTVGIYNAYYGVVADEAPPVDYNIDTPLVATDGMLWSDTGGQAVPYTVNTTTEDPQLLVFHLHGKKGAREEILDLPPVLP